MGTAAFVHNAIGTTGVAESGALFRAFAWQTSTPAVVYTDVTLDTPAAHPQAADAAGHLKLYFDSTQDYTFTVKSANDASTLLSVDYKDGVFTITQASLDNFNSLQDALVSFLTALESSDATLVAFAGLIGADGDTVEWTGTDAFTVVRPRFGTYSAMRAYSVAQAATVGRFGVTDRGDGIYTWQSGDQSANVAIDEVTSSEGDGGVWVAPTADKTGASGAWKRVFTGNVSGAWYGSLSSSPSAKLIAAANYCANAGIGYVEVDVATLTLNAAVDMQGVGIIGTGTAISNTSYLQQVGPLKNCYVRGFPTDVDNILSMPQAGGLHRKIAYQESSTLLAIFAKRPGDGYIRFNHRYNNYASGPADTGGQCENWRLCEVEHHSEVYVYKHTADAESGTWDPSANVLTAQAFPSGTSGTGTRALKYRSTITLNDTIDYNVTATKIGQKGVAAFLCSAGASTAIEMYVNSTLQKTFSAVLVGTQYILEVEYELDLIGTNTIQFKNTVNGKGMRPIGVEFYRLKDLPAGRNDVDEIAYGNYNLDYIDSIGANDYAWLSVSEGAYFGSYHGGETSRQAALLYIDGKSQTFPATTGDFYVGESVKIHQRTTIASAGTDTADIDSLYSYYGDGHCVLTCAAKNVDVTVEQIYNCMTATNENFLKTEVPKYLTIASGVNYLGRYDTVTQVREHSSAINQRLTTKMTLYPMGGPWGANMLSNGPRIQGVPGSYNKLYYGPCMNTEQTITEDMSWTTERLFW